MIRMMRGLAASAVLALAAVSGGCAGYGMDDIYGGRGGWGGSSEIHGRVEGVHSRYNTIRVRRDNGRTADVRYDGRTEVVDHDRRYRAESLDRGDYVSLRVSRDSRGQLYTRHVTVRRNAAPVYDRGRAPDRRRDDDRRWDDRRDRRDDDRYYYDARAVEGRVERVDRSGRRFLLRGTRGNVWVALPSNAGRGTRERFQRLRTGEYVSVSGRYVSRDRFQLERFR
jgi:hypothetical protein